MKHYIEIENVGPIKKARIDLSKYVVLIGPQASGKSIIAKLISIFRSENFLKTKGYSNWKELFLSYLKDSYLDAYIKKDSKIYYTSFFLIYKLENENFEVILDKGIDKIAIAYDTKNPKEIKPSIYIPAERIIISILSRSIYSIVQNKINLPQILLDFAANYEKSRNHIKEYSIPFLKAKYAYKNSKETLEINEQEVLITEASSGFQTLVPMLLVCEYFLKDGLAQTYIIIIEEPELNLFPAAQKDLVYHLINIINNSYSEVSDTTHDLLMTTHSPYVLAALNNLLLAGKIKAEQQENYTQAKQIVKGNYYINKGDLNVYALKNGKTKNIIDKSTGLISENELDMVSDVINNEFNQLSDIYFG